MKRALELQPGRAEAHADLGKIYAHQGRKDEARSHLEKALELKPDLEDAKRTLEKLK